GGTGEADGDGVAYSVARHRRDREIYGSKAPRRREDKRNNGMKCCRAGRGSIFNAGFWGPRFSRGMSDASEWFEEGPAVAGPWHSALQCGDNLCYILQQSGAIGPYGIASRRRMP